MLPEYCENDNFFFLFFLRTSEGVYQAVKYSQLHVVLKRKTISKCFFLCNENMYYDY